MEPRLVDGRYIVVAVLLACSVGSSSAYIMASRLPLRARGLSSRYRTRQSDRRRCCCALAAGNSDAGQLAAETNDAIPRWSQRKMTNATRGSSAPAGMPNKDGRRGVSVNDIELSMADGMVLRGQRWSGSCQRRDRRDGDNDSSNRSSSENKDNDNDGTAEFRSPGKKTRILALHGWLDNCRSFHYLAPKLIEKLQQSTNIEAELVAIDLPGHGWSSHRSIDGHMTIMTEITYYVAEIIDALGWGGDGPANNNDGEPKKNSDHRAEVNDDNGDGDGAVNDRKVALIGHSMGGAMASLYAGIFPEQISHVVSIDIYGPEPERPGGTASRIRSHVSQRRSAWGPLGKPRVVYPSVEKAIERRRKAAAMLVGRTNLCLSEEAAKEIVTRSMEAVYREEDGRVGESFSGAGETESIRGYRFRHDPRWLWPSLQYLTADQIESILERVECPVCILAAEDGYPFAEDRIERIVAALKPQVHEILPGSHHLHADPDTADAVVDAIYAFFVANDGSNNDGNG